MKKKQPESGFPVIGLLIAGVVIAACIAMAYHTNSTPEPEPPIEANFTIASPTPTGESLAQMLQRQYEKAEQRGQKPFVQFTATWCGPCNIVKRNLRDPLMMEAFDSVYLVRVDVDQWRPQIEQGEFRFEGIPTFFEIDANGSPTGRTLSSTQFASMSPAGMAPAFASFFGGEEVDSES